jgi:hypothetical protein
MVDICGVFFYSNIPITLTSILFFLYSNIKLADYSDSGKEVCRDYLYYNITHLALILFPVLVMGSFILCNRVCTSVLFVLNGVLVLGQLVDKYVEDEKHCNTECETQCQELQELSSKTNICLIVLGAMYILTGVGVVYKFVKCCC